MNISEEERKAARQRGIEAFMAGRPSGFNPCHPGELAHAEWAAGWWAAHDFAYMTQYLRKI